MAWFVRGIWGVRMREERPPINEGEGDENVEEREREGEERNMGSARGLECGGF